MIDSLLEVYTHKKYSSQWKGHWNTFSERCLVRDSSQTVNAIPVRLKIFSKLPFLFQAPRWRKKKNKNYAFYPKVPLCRSIHWHFSSNENEWCPFMSNIMASWSTSWRHLKNTESEFSVKRTGLMEVTVGMATRETGEMKHTQAAVFIPRIPVQCVHKIHCSKQKYGCVTDIQVSHSSPDSVLKSFFPLNLNCFVAKRSGSHCWV